MARRNEKADGEKQQSGEVIQLVRNEEKPKKPSLQVQLDILTARLERHAHEHEFRLGYAEGNFYCYQQGHWRALSEADRQNLVYVLQQICVEVGLVYAEKHHMIWKHLESDDTFALDKVSLDAEPWVAVRNGTVHVETGDIVPHDYTHFTTRFVDIEYSKSRNHCPTWLKILDDMFGDRPPEARAAIIKLLQEWFGIAVAGGATTRTPRELRKGLFLYGPKRAGKSTITDTLQALLGMDKIVAAPPSDVASRFGLEAFLSASGWICEEVSGLDKKIDTARIKALITGERIAVQRKMTKDTTLRFHGPVCWAGNSQPNFPESSHAVYDRMIMIQFRRSFSTEEAQKLFGDLKTVEWLVANGELPGIFNWALEGYRRVKARGKYVIPRELEIAGEEWRSSNDAIYAFLSECCEPVEDCYNTATTIAWTAWAYVKNTRNEFASLHTIRRDVRAALPERYPQVKIDDREFIGDGSRVYVYKGLRLNKTGLAWLEKAKRDSEIADEQISAINFPIFGGGGEK
jgi:P4 family phage/plasmid primase-like protien